MSRQAALLWELEIFDLAKVWLPDPIADDSGGSGAALPEALYYSGSVGTDPHHDIIGDILFTLQGSLRLGRQWYLWSGAGLPHPAYSLEFLNVRWIVCDFTNPGVTNVVVQTASGQSEDNPLPTDPINLSWIIGPGYVDRFGVLQTPPL